MKVQWSARLARGKLLLSDMGRVLARITDDTCGQHDCVAGASTRSGDARKYGVNPTRRNSHENFVLAAPSTACRRATLALASLSLRLSSPIRSVASNGAKTP